MDPLSDPPLSLESLVEVKSRVDYGEVREGLRVVTEEPARAIHLFGIQPEVIRIAVHLLEVQPRLVYLSGASEALDKPERTHAEGALGPLQSVLGGGLRQIAIDE